MVWERHSQITSLDPSTETLDEVEEGTITDESQEYHFRTITSTARKYRQCCLYHGPRPDYKRLPISNNLIVSLLFLVDFNRHRLSPIQSEYETHFKILEKQQEFVENLHELRTPLTIIQNNLDHLLPSQMLKSSTT